MHAVARLQRFDPVGRLELTAAQHRGERRLLGQRQIGRP